MSLHSKTAGENVARTAHVVTTLRSSWCPCRIGAVLAQDEVSASTFSQVLMPAQC